MLYLLFDRYDMIFEFVRIRTFLSSLLKTLKGIAKITKMSSKLKTEVGTVLIRLEI